MPKIPPLNSRSVADRYTSQTWMFSDMCMLRSLWVIVHQQGGSGTNDIGVGYPMRWWHDTHKLDVLEYKRHMGQSPCQPPVWHAYGSKAWRHATSKAWDLTGCIIWWSLKFEREDCPIGTEHLHITWGGETSSGVVRWRWNDEWWTNFACEELVQSPQSPPPKKNAKQPVSIKEGPDVLGIIPYLLLTSALPKTTHFPSPEWS